MTMTPLQLFQIIWLLLMLLNTGDAFLTPISVTMVRQQRYCFIQENSLGAPPSVVLTLVGSSNSNNNNDAEIDEKSSSMTYDEADVSLKSEDDKRRLDNQGFGLTDEVRNARIGIEETRK